MVVEHGSPQLGLGEFPARGQPHLGDLQAGPFQLRLGHPPNLRGLAPGGGQNLLSLQVRLVENDAVAQRAEIGHTRGCSGRYVRFHTSPARRGGGIRPLMLERTHIRFPFPQPSIRSVVDHVT